MTIEQEKVQELLVLLNRRYPGWTGFSDPRFVEEEIGYKRETIAKASQLLSAHELKGLLDAGNHDEFIRRLETIGRAPHFLYLATPKSSDLAVLYQTVCS